MLPRLPGYQDTEHRQASHRGRPARTVLRAADVYTDAGSSDDRSLSAAIRSPDLGHSVGRYVRASHGRVAVAPGPEAGGISDGDRRQMAPRTRQARVLAAAARLRLPVRATARRDRLLHAEGTREERLVPQQRAGR